jgi:hypothetical protein
MVGLVRRGLVTAQPERTFAAGKPVERTRVRITDADRQALAQKEGSALAEPSLRRNCPRGTIVQ